MESGPGNFRGGVFLFRESVPMAESAGDAGAWLSSLIHVWFGAAVMRGTNLADAVPYIRTRARLRGQPRRPARVYGGSDSRYGLARLAASAWYGGERPLSSVEAFRGCVGRYTELGVATLAVLWSRGERSAAQMAVLEQAAAECRRS